MPRKKPRIAPLHGSFIITSFVGLIITILFVTPRSLPWGITLTIFFLVMIIAATISTIKGPKRI